MTVKDSLLNEQKAKSNIEQHKIFQHQHLKQQVKKKRNELDNG